VALTQRRELVRAAGGVVRRAAGSGPEVLLVHRPRYDDWTFPKGKAHPGESAQETALREVAEETGLHCFLGQELPSTSYRDSRGRPKVVRYWTMRVVSGSFKPDAEVDEIRWLAHDEAEDTLSYARDLEVLRAIPPPLLVNRHASAGDSKQWVGDDSIRPLDDRGLRQASHLVEQLAPFRIDRILSSPFTRCVQTVEPLSQARGIEVELADDLAEGAGAERVRSLLLELGGTATAICGHGPELVPLFGKTKKGATVIVEAADGELGELGRLPPPE
jgi:8-oxo-dGTP diphosphatase